MRHVKVVSKDVPASALILNWPKEVTAAPSAKAAYTNSLFFSPDSLDPNDTNDSGFFGLFLGPI
jgi:hypothetical protein